MAEMNSLLDALVEELKDLYDAEQQLISALPIMAKAATNRKLKKAIEDHLEEKCAQVARLAKVFALLDERPTEKHCAGIAGILEETADTLKPIAPAALMDARIIAGGQRAEHYEIAAYGTVITWAKTLDLDEIADLLGQTLDEENAADYKLSSLAKAGINEAAVRGEEVEDEPREAPEDTDEEPEPQEIPVAGGRRSTLPENA